KAPAPTPQQKKAEAAGLRHWEAKGPLLPLPRRDKDGCLSFPDYPDFKPNMTPEEVLRAGSFGGTYFRPIFSRTTKKQYGDTVHQEFPSSWFKGLDIATQVTSSRYQVEVNKYRVKSGLKLEHWEASGWMREQDPYGWFQWYCRFFLGRRTQDDQRQVGRWTAAIGPKGRWRTFLVGQCVRQGISWNDPAASPVTRQTLQHWGFTLTKYSGWQASSLHGRSDSRERSRERSAAERSSSRQRSGNQEEAGRQQFIRIRGAETKKDHELMTTLRSVPIRFLFLKVTVNSIIAKNNSKTSKKQQKYKSDRGENLLEPTVLGLWLLLLELLLMSLLLLFLLLFAIIIIVVVAIVVVVA
ncbi:unnamed protein product, partial [Polarella glacialis]